METRAPPTTRTISIRPSIPQLQWPALAVSCRAIAQALDRRMAHLTRGRNCATFLPYAGVLAHMARAVTAAERSLRQIDHFDYFIRRWVIPVYGVYIHQLGTPQLWAGYLREKVIPARVE